MNPDAIAAGLGAVLTAIIGITLTLREFRSRERKAAREEMGQLLDDLYGVDEAYIAQRHYSFELRQMVADNGELPPPPPRYSKQLTRQIATPAKKAAPKPPPPKP